MEKLSCVRQSAQELKSKMIMQGDDAIYITDEKTEIQKLSKVINYIVTEPGLKRRATNLRSL